MNSFSGRPIYTKELDSRSKQGLSMSEVITMELTPDHLAHTIYKANRVWQMEGQCETFSGGNRVISLNPEPPMLRLYILPPTSLKSDCRR